MSCTTKIDLEKLRKLSVLYEVDNQPMKIDVDLFRELLDRIAQLEKENVAKQRDAGRWKPKKWAEEEQANGNTGIRWVNEEGVHGRPTDHDVREYLIRTETARGCHCDSCQAFYKFDTAMESNRG